MNQPHSLASPSSTPPTGILIIDKPGAHTSMDVCAIVRGKLRRGGAAKGIKVGHGGTLDPMATGVLVVLVGKATPLCDRVMAGEKEYTGTIDLAHRSSTDDAEGDVTPVHVDVPPTLDQLRGALPAFVGHIQQIPPNFSALNIGGRRAYQIAREGGEVTLAAREVFIRDFTITRYEWPFVDVHVTCGKGTYIRSLARDLGAAVACGGMLTQLRRTRVGRFDIRNSRPLQELPQVLTQADLLPVPLDLS